MTISELAALRDLRIFLRRDAFETVLVRRGAVLVLLSGEERRQASYGYPARFIWVSRSADRLDKGVADT